MQRAVLCELGVVFSCLSDTSIPSWEGILSQYAGGLKSLLGTDDGYTQCRVLHSLHVRLSKVVMPGKTGIRENETYNLLVQYQELF